MESKDVSIKSKLEAMLFSSGRKMDIMELSRLSNAKTDDIKNALVDLKTEYDEKKSSVMIVNEGDSWKITVREQYLPLVRSIVTEMELSRTIMETLAVIAFKYPIKQSDLIRIRTNKAYDHVHELKDMGFVSSEKSGRTRLLKLTDKFFKYFEVSGEKDIRELFDKKIKESVEEVKEEIKEEESIEEEKLKEVKEEIKEEIVEKEKELNEENKEIQEENKEEIEEQNPETVEGENKE